MAHNGDFSEIYTTSTVGLSIEEIAACLGRGTGDLGTLCSDIDVVEEGVVIDAGNRIRPLAKYKPEVFSKHGFLTDSERSGGAQHYSFRWLYSTSTYREYPHSSMSVSGTNRSYLLNTKMAYQKPTSYYRQLDFASYTTDAASGSQGIGYYNGAPRYVLHCANTGTVCANVLDNNSSTHINFYGLFRNTGSYTANKVFNENTGIGTAALVPTSPTNYWASRCLSLEDLIVGGTNPTLNGVGAYFGVYLIKGTALEGFHPCAKQINDYGELDYDMFRLPIIGPGGLIDPQTTSPTGKKVSESAVEVLDENNQPIYGDNVESGTYTAVPLLRYNGYYYPMFPYGDYGKNFTLIIGGQEMYGYQASGLSLDAVASTAISLTTTSSSVYVTVKIWNVSYGQITTVSTSQLSKFRISVKVTGSITGMIDGTQQTVTINRTQSSAMYSPTTQFTIPRTSGSSSSNNVNLLFVVDSLWQTDTHVLPTRIDSGHVTLECNLYYDGVEIGEGASYTQLLSVTYGS